MSDKPGLPCWLLILLSGCISTSQIIPDPGAVFQDQLSDATPGPAMVIIPTGSFTMGSPDTEELRFSNEGPQHIVTISKAFAIGKYEITFAEYDKYAEATSTEKPGDRGWGVQHWGRGNMPLFNVSWFDAKQYARWLSEETGQTYRLPTEAEWEYAARAGSETRYHTGNCIDTEQANYHGGNRLEGCNNTGLYRGKTVATGLLQANQWGLHDIHGNVLEWTQDCWHDNYRGAPVDGQPWVPQPDISDDFEEFEPDCPFRILRGGSWSGRPRDIRSATRARNRADFKSIFIGFRIVREL